MNVCAHCGLAIKGAPYRYCSNKCQLDYQYADYIKKWKRGEVNGVRGINAKNISRHIRTYLFNKYDNACSLCGWSKKNPATNMVPLEIDHIDGNSDNNKEGNLQLLCPNCHSLTPSFRNLNKGYGREWRRTKYLKSQK